RDEPQRQGVRADGVGIAGSFQNRAREGRRGSGLAGRGHFNTHAKERAPSHRAVRRDPLLRGSYTPSRCNLHPRPRPARFRALTPPPRPAPPTPFPRETRFPPPPSRSAARRASAPGAPAPASSPHIGVAAPPESRLRDAPSTRDT